MKPIWRALFESPTTDCIRSAVTLDFIRYHRTKLLWFVDCRVSSVGGGWSCYIGPAAPPWFVLKVQAQKWVLWWSCGLIWCSKCVYVLEWTWLERWKLDWRFFLFVFFFFTIFVKHLLYFPHHPPSPSCSFHFSTLVHSYDGRLINLYSAVSRQRRAGFLQNVSSVGY